MIPSARFYRLSGIATLTGSCCTDVDDRMALGCGWNAPRLVPKGTFKKRRFIGVAEPEFIHDEPRQAIGPYAALLKSCLQTGRFENSPHH